MSAMLAGLPSPTPDAADAPLWAAAARRELVIQTCADCGTMRHPPRQICPACQSMRQTWTPVSGRGEIFSFTVVHHPAHAALVGQPPYAVILVSLEEAPEIRFLSNLAGSPNAAFVGMPVEILWEERPDGAVLPRFQERGKS